MNIPIKNINNCKNLDDNKIIEIAKKLKVNYFKSDKNKTCNLIKKKYTKDNPCNINIENNTNLIIKKHQISVANHLFNNRGAIVVHSVGTGKTLTAITTSQCLLLNKIIKNVIVITPTSLQNNFINQLKMYGLDDNNINKNYIFYTIQGIVNSINNNNISNPIKSLIIIDEAHNIRKLEGSRFDTIFNYSKNAHKILLLTATPLINYNYDIINLISLINNKDPISIEEFNEIKKSKKDIKEYVEGIFSFYAKSSNDNDFPSKKVLEIYLPMSQSYYKIYNEIEKGETTKIPDFINKNVNVFYNGLRRASNIIDNKSPKVDWIIQKIKSEPTAKFIIFSNFISMGINPIINWLKNNKILHDSVTGDQTIQKRQISVDKYNNNTINILFISKAGSEGLDLKNTTHIIIMEPSWNENTIEQIIGRGVRYKSHEQLPKYKQHVTVYKLYTVKPFEYDIINKITNKHLLEYKNKMLSVDLYLRNYSWLKQQNIISFYDLLKKYKINT